MNDQPIILFDGVCNFCNSSVNFVLKRNTRTNICFAALQSAAGRKLLQQYHLPVDNMQSFIFIENGIVYNRSTAVLKVCRHLKGLWPLCYLFIIVPRFLRDGMYNLVAKNRYRWFGKKESCMIPAPEVIARFLN
jgi:predicted DCC family thiol-disulfide oxidoreductase YuxK